MSDPPEIHLKATKIIPRYVKGTTNFGIHYFKNDDVKLVDFGDLNWVINLDDKKYTSSNFFNLGSRMIIWI